MSATTPDIYIETRGAGRGEDVRAGITGLHFRRRLWRASGRVFVLTGCALVLLCVLGALDWRFSLPRVARAAVVWPVLLACVSYALYTMFLLMRRRELSGMAHELERAAGSKQNALATYAESLEPQAAQAEPPYMRLRLERQARGILAAMDERAVAPRRPAALGAITLAASLLLLLALRFLAPTAFAREVRRLVWLERALISARASDTGEAANAADSSRAIVIEDVRVRVQPPAYSGLSASEINGDAPVRALAGSEVLVEMFVRGDVSGATLIFGGATNRMRALGDGRYQGAFTANASGVFEARVIADESLAIPTPIVRAVEIYPDAAPGARISEPASDQLLRGVPSTPVTVRWSAQDDLGLAGAVLKFIRSRGDGDAAKFESGTLPLGQTEQVSAREWRGTTAIDLARLGVVQGDTLVYWLEVRDRNPSSGGVGRSNTLAIAIAAPEPLKLNLGDLGPNEIGRFLLSQRMIVIHTEQLHKQRTRLAPDEFRRRANEIAAEQRDFKNSFNNYINIEGAGGEERARDAGISAPESVEEKVREASDERTGTHLHSIPPPPAGAPSSVRDMVYAINAMWSAEDALTEGDTATALTYEREALARLKRAQAAVRYVPPIVARSKPVDLKRRYAGELAEIKTRLEKLSRRAEGKDALALRSALADAYAALSDLQSTLDVPQTGRASAVARARDRAGQAANKVSVAGGDHAATVAEALGQLRIVETELAQMETGGTAEEYAARISKSLKLLTQAAGNLYAIADADTRAFGGDSNRLLPADDRRAADYFRRLR